jgi:nucleoside-diphosphate-sugar epimerase
MKPTVLVTGSEGSLMSYVIPALLERNYEVVGVDIKGHRNSHKYTYINLDLHNNQRLEEVFRCYQIDYVLHAAASIYGVKGFNDLGADIIANDLTSTINLLHISVYHNVKKFIFTSSSMVYEQVPAGMSNWDIDKFPAPKTYYGLSKYTGEKIIKAFFEQYHLPYIIWRPFNIITPWEKAGREQGYSHVFADFIEMIVKKQQRKIKIIGDGQQIRCFTWIDEVADAIANFSFGKEQGEFNLGNIEPITMLELANLIFKTAKEAGLIDPIPDYTLEFEHIKAPEKDVRTRVPNMYRTKEVFGWMAKCGIESSIKQCLRELEI